MRAICVICKEPFNQRYSWAKKCFPCWKNEKKYPGFDYFKILDKKSLPDKRLPSLPEWEKMLMRVIKLTHPDRHGNCVEANEVTRWLLEQRLRLK